MGSRLEHPMVARISLDGYATKEIRLTDGPMRWISVNGRNHGEYWLLKSDHFEVDLQPIEQVFTGGVRANLSGPGKVDLRPELPIEELVRKTKPAVVYLRGLDKSGTGFFVTDTGVIVTNAHLARGEESLLTILPGGRALEAKIVYIDPDLDVALAKVEGKNFPHLTLADASMVRQGESVLAIGNPGDAMLFSVTKGVVSAVGKFSQRRSRHLDSDGCPGQSRKQRRPALEQPGRSDRHQHAKTDQEKCNGNWIRSERVGCFASTATLLP